MNQKYTSIIRALTVAILMFVGASARADIPADKSAAVIFVYQRIGEDTVPQGNISLDQFKEHINELQKDGFSVLPLAEIVSTLKKGGSLPPKTVAITFEGAYQTTLTNALPVLEEAHMPFTVFFAADAVDGSAGRMSWDSLKKLQKNKLAGLGLLPATYEHMVGQTADKNAELINRALARAREMLGITPPFFAYPYGEISNALKTQVAGYKFEAAFGQHSGVAYSGSDFNALPRFTMTNEFGDLDRFLLTANALPLPVTEVTPVDAAITQNPPKIGFSITPDLTNTGKLSCFASGQEGKLPLARIGKNRIEIRPTESFGDRRTRINCTLPVENIAPGDLPSWRWFGLLLTAPAIAEAGEAPTGGSADGPDASDTLIENE